MQLKRYTAYTKSKRTGGSLHQYPTEEKISDNIKRLRNEQWFKPMFAEHMTLFLENYDIRLVIGVAKLDIILANEKKRKDFADTLAYLITIKSKKAK